MSAFTLGEKPPARRPHCLAERRTLHHQLSCQSIAHMGLHQEETIELPGGSTAPKPAGMLLRVLGASPPPAPPSPSQENLATPCLFATPARRTGPVRVPHLGSFGCSVNLPLGSRSADPHSTAVGVEACSTPVLNRAQRGCDVWPLFTRWSTRYCNQDLRRTTLEEGERGQPRPARRSSVPFLHGDALLPACVITTTPHHSAGGSSEGMSALAWAPSIFGAARFGR